MRTYRPPAPHEPRLLTPRQEQVARFIARYTDRHGYPPSVREIGTALGIGSTNGVNDHLKALVRKGVLAAPVPDPRRVGRPARSLKLVDGKALSGGAPASTPFTVRADGSVMFSALIPAGLFAALLARSVAASLTPNAVLCAALTAWLQETQPHAT